MSEIEDLDVEQKWIEIEGGFKVLENWICHHCEEERLKAGKLPLEAEERFSFGVYAGKYCDRCWSQSGYRDVEDEDTKFDPLDAGEVLEPEDY